MHSKEQIAKAKKRVKAKKEFYQHLMAYVIINFFLFVINMVTTPFTWWFHFALLAWGVGLAFHYVDVFGIPVFNILSKEWEEKELEEELRKFSDEGTEHVGFRDNQGNISEELELKEVRKNIDETGFV